MPQQVAIIALVFICLIPVVVRMGLRHVKEMAEIQYRRPTNPQLESDVQELKQQVADIRELMIDMSLDTTNRKIADRVNQDVLN